MNCSTQDKPVVAEAPTETVTIQEGTPVETETVISRKIVDRSTNNVVQYIPDRKTINIGGFTIGFNHGRETGKCYYNWSTDGTECY